MNGQAKQMKRMVDGLMTIVKGQKKPKTRMASGFSE
jgi:hypothetical protein